MNVFTLARLTFAEAARRRILLAALVLGLIFLLIYAIGFYFIMREVRSDPFVNPLIINEMQNFLYLAGLYVVNFLTVMMTVLTSVDTLSGEISSGTIHTLVSKPVHRWEVVAGKWLGYAGMLTLYLLLMAGGVSLIAIFIGGGASRDIPTGVAMLLLNALVLLSVSLLGGSTLSTLANGVLVFGMFSIAFIGGWIEQIGSFILNETASLVARNIGIITSLMLPSEALWKRAAAELQSPLSSLMEFSPFTARTVPSDLMIAYAVLYMFVAFALTIRRFNSRDL